jgi:hypothetical protein
MVFGDIGLGASRTCCGSFYTTNVMSVLSYRRLVYLSWLFVLLLILPTYTENVQQAHCARQASNLSSARGKLKTGGPFVLVKFMSTP